jgi:hypothetical protein
MKWKKFKIEGSFYMSIGTRGFIEFLIEKIKKEGIYGSGYSNEEREEDVIRTIWKAYEDWNGEE